MCMGAQRKFNRLTKSDIVVRIVIFVLSVVVGWCIEDKYQIWSSF